MVCRCVTGASTGSEASYVSSRQNSSGGSATRRQFPSSATLFAGEPLRGVSASSFDLQEPTPATGPTPTTGHSVSAAVNGRFNTAYTQGGRQRFTVLN